MSPRPKKTTASPRAKASAKKQPAKETEYQNEPEHSAPLTYVDVAKQAQVDELASSAGDLTARFQELSSRLDALDQKFPQLDLEVRQQLQTVANDVNALGERTATQEHLKAYRLNMDAVSSFVGDRVDKLEGSISESVAVLTSRTDQLDRRISANDFELEKHRSFHRAHGPEAMTEAVQAQMTKVWSVVGIGLGATGAVAVTALIRTLAG